MDDRRVYTRFPVNFNLRFLNLWEGKEGQAVTYDISAKGLGITADQELPLHTAIEMWLKVPDRDEPVYTRGEVAWTRGDDLDKYTVGIDLERADLLSLTKAVKPKKRMEKDIESRGYKSLDSLR
jgi:hypothetical protein